MTKKFSLAVESNISNSPASYPKSNNLNQPLDAFLITNDLNNNSSCIRRRSLSLSDKNEKDRIFSICDLSDFEIAQNETNMSQPRSENNWETTPSLPSDKKHQRRNSTALKFQMPKHISNE